MEMRLAYRIASIPHKIGFHPGKFGEAERLRYYREVRAEKEHIKGCVKVVLDQVSEYYAGSDPDKLATLEAAPNWAPPWETFFVEWNFPTRYRGPDGGWKEVPRESFTQAGATVWTYSADRITDRWTTQKPADSRWVLRTHIWGTFGGSGPTRGVPVWTGLHMLIFVGPSGAYLGHQIGGPGAEVEEGYDQDDWNHFAWQVAMHLGLGISFAHCKNVVQTEEKVNNGYRFHRDKRCPVYSFRTLDIDPMKTVLRREGGLTGEAGGNGLGKALHICRGHFATYTPERPLFGKRVGTFWVPDHVRGRRENGVAEKDYNVLPKAETPAPDA